MANEINDIFSISGSALRAQSMRMKIIAENIANVGTTASTAGENPYQRQVISFKKVFDNNIGAYKVRVARIGTDKAEPIKKFDPSNPVADAQGYVLTPNVNALIETVDMGDANRAYQANLNVIAASRTMVLKTLAIIQ
ncbi:MAG: flagellar basal body rod protein FlgC [Alphaproteobacteria bacterium]|nr:flagellar basal body rod protein FlgC [Alphaproteobacteria bacterium]MCL2506026.1 flagellar basal body rod protein FlgC [Alphaproteobacteria bacterium]